MVTFIMPKRPVLKKQYYESGFDKEFCQKGLIYIDKLIVRIKDVESRSVAKSPRVQQYLAELTYEWLLWHQLIDRMRFGRF